MRWKAPCWARMVARVELRLGLLDGFELRHDGTPVAVPLVAQRLLAFLALHARPLQRMYVAGTLWLETTDDHAGASLRSALWRLGRHRADVVQATATHVALCPAVLVDLHEASA